MNKENENKTITDDEYNKALNKTEELIRRLNKEGQEIWIQRFDGYSRFLHLLIIVSFLSLALTGMIIKFSDVGIFQFLYDLLGGYEVTGFIHRFAAIITIGYFVLHIGYLIKKKVKRKITFKKLLSGEKSLIPNKNDLTELIQTFKWFVGRGKRPEYGRWTYWEKFDYFAVFWGVMIIGISGLILWFPEFFTMMGLPGWMINVATIIHSDEALLATGFIFTVHFFNTHFRADKFPMDQVIFLGSVPFEEFKHDRPREYEMMIKTDTFEEHIVPPPSVFLIKLSKIFGFVALAIGLFIVVAIIYSMLFVYI